MSVVEVGRGGRVRGDGMSGGPGFGFRSPRPDVEMVGDSGRERGSHCRIRFPQGWLAAN